MLMLVMSNNFLQLFFGWEAVGLVSYLLIGFWFKRPTAIFANMKAFLVNRVGDFGFLLSRGMSPRRTVLVNVISSLATLLGALVIYIIGSQITIPLAPILALTAGFFIYIAASDIIPDIHERPHAEANKQAAMLILGVIVVAAMITVLQV